MLKLVYFLFSFTCKSLLKSWIQVDVNEASLYENWLFYLFNCYLDITMCAVELEFIFISVIFLFFPPPSLGSPFLAGARVNAKDNMWLTPLHRAVASRSEVNMHIYFVLPSYQLTGWYDVRSSVTQTDLSHCSYPKTDAHHFLASPRILTFYSQTIQSSFVFVSNRNLGQSNISA